MINEIVTAVYTRLSGDSALADELADTVIGSGSAVYSALPVPSTAELPYVVISGPISDTPDDAFDAEYRRLLLDIHCYTAKPDGGGGSVAGVNRIAERVRTLLHRVSLTADPRSLVCEVQQIITNDDQTAFGRIVSVRLLVAN